MVRHSSTYVPCRWCQARLVSGRVSIALGAILIVNSSRISEWDMYCTAAYRRTAEQLTNFEFSDLLVWTHRHMSA